MRSSVTDTLDSNVRPLRPKYELYSRMAMNDDDDTRVKPIMHFKCAHKMCASLDIT